MQPILTGPFTCDVTFQSLGGPPFEREERDGITYLTRRDYMSSYETILHFENGSELPIKALVTGELNQQVVVRATAMAGGSTSWEHTGAGCLRWARWNPVPIVRAPPRSADRLLRRHTGQCTDHSRSTCSHLGRSGPGMPPPRSSCRSRLPR